MKTPLLFGTAFAILGVAATPMFAQTQTATSTSGGAYVQTSKLIGTKVKASQGEDIGVIKDVVLDRNTGCMAYTVLSAGGGGHSRHWTRKNRCHSMDSLFPLIRPKHFNGSR